MGKYTNDKSQNSKNQNPDLQLSRFELTIIANFWTTYKPFHYQHESIKKLKNGDIGTKIIWVKDFQNTL